MGYVDVNTMAQQHVCYLYCRCDEKSTICSIR